MDDFISLPPRPHISAPTPGLWILGGFLYALGRSVMAFGANLQRYSMTQELLRPPKERRDRLGQPYLMMGVSLFIGSGIFLSLALLFAPQTLLAPCGIVIFVANAIFAHLLNGETFVWREDGVYNAMAMAGVFLCVISAPKEEKGQDGDVVRTYTQQELLDRYHEPTFIVFITLVLLVVAAAYILKERVLHRAGGDWTKVTDGVGKLTLNLSFGIMAGTLGGFNITLTKSIFQVIGGEWEDGGEDAMLTSVMCWTLGFALLFAFFFQILCVLDGLEKCAALVVVPVQSVSEECTATLGGLLYFQDYTQFDFWSAFGYALGDIIAITSVILLVRIRIARRAEDSQASPKGNKENLISDESETEDTSSAQLGF